MDTINFNSSTWRAVKAQAEERIAELKDQLAGLGITERESLIIRGRIDELSLLIETESTPPRNDVA